MDLEKYSEKSNKCKICQASYQTKQGLWSQKMGKADAFVLSNASITEVFNSSFLQNFRCQFLILVLSDR